MASRRIEESPHTDERVASLINEYFDRTQAGEAITPDSFVAEHPHKAEALRPYLEALTLLDRVRSSAGATAETAPALAGDAELPEITGFKLLAEIGRGGMGVVYKALQESTKRVVALKVMLAGPFASSSGRRRFEREVELAARLRHAHIVRVLESGCVGQQSYYAMDLIEGVPVDRFVATQQPDVPVTLRIFQRICEAVEFAHDHGVVHRDLKPANVLIDEAGEPHILDFGLAKALDQGAEEELLTTRVSSPGQVVGTLPYLSPEQATGRTEEIDARTDVYAMGVMLFEAITGSLPFDATVRPSELVQRILDSPPAAPSSFTKRVDSDLETIILRTLEKDPDRRYQSASELGADLGRYLGGEPIRARRPSGLYVLRKKIVKHRVLATAFVAILVLALSTLLVGRWWRARETARARHEVLEHQQMLERGVGPRGIGQANVLFAKHPELPEASLVWAQAMYRSNQQEDAIVNLERVLQGDPSRWACRALLAEIYRETGHEDRASALNETGKREAPDTAAGWYLRSFTTLDPETARRDAHEAVRRDPSQALAWDRLTHLHLENGNLEAALDGASKLIDLGESPDDWRIFMGHVLVRLGRAQEAIEQYTRVIESSADGAGACVFRAHAYRRIGAHEKAVADYDRLLQGEVEETAYVWHLYQRATPLWILGRKDEALEDYRRVRNLLGRPSYADARRFIILREEGRRAEADSILGEALRDVDDPWLSEIFRCLAGEVTPDALMETAKAGGNLEHACEAGYYAAEVALLDGRVAEARRWFEQCVETGVIHDLDIFPPVPMNEYELARWRLESLPPAGPEAVPSKEH